MANRQIHIQLRPITDAMVRVWAAMTASEPREVVQDALAKGLVDAAMVQGETFLKHYRQMCEIKCGATPEYDPLPEAAAPVVVAGQQWIRRSFNIEEDTIRFLGVYGDLARMPPAQAADGVIYGRLLRLANARNDDFWRAFIDAVTYADHVGVA